MADLADATPECDAEFDMIAAIAAAAAAEAVVDASEPAAAKDESNTELEEEPLGSSEEEETARSDVVTKEAVATASDGADAATHFAGDGCSADTNTASYECEFNCPAPARLPPLHENNTSEPS